MENKLVEIDCQSPGCKTKVMIRKNTPYFGVLCPEHSKSQVYTYKNERL